MICPQCQGEYRDGFTVCATCEMPLIPGSPITANAQSSRLRWRDWIVIFFGVAVFLGYFATRLNPAIPNPVRWIVLMVVIVVICRLRYSKSKD